MPDKAYLLVDLTKAPRHIQWKKIPPVTRWNCAFHDEHFFSKDLRTFSHDVMHVLPWRCTPNESFYFLREIDGSMDFIYLEHLDFNTFKCVTSIGKWIYRNVDRTHHCTHSYVLKFNPCSLNLYAQQTIYLWYLWFASNKFKFFRCEKSSFAMKTFENSSDWTMSFNCTYGNKDR